jgi:hypothetical protein
MSDEVDEMSAASRGYAAYKRWLLDATFWPQRVFVPIGDDDSLILGINLMAEWPPGHFAGVIHADGQDAVDSFCDEHLVELAEMLAQHA